MNELTFVPVDWRYTPEVASLLYKSFPHRRREDLRSCVTNSTLWVGAYKGKTLAGIMGVWVHGFKDNLTYISWLAVACPFRRQGIASHMLELAYLEWFGPIFVSVYEANTEAYMLYSNFGFEEYAYQYRMYWMQLV